MTTPDTAVSESERRLLKLYYDEAKLTAQLDGRTEAQLQLMHHVFDQYALNRILILREANAQGKEFSKMKETLLERLAAAAEAIDIVRMLAEGKVEIGDLTTAATDFMDEYNKAKTRWEAKS